MDAEAEAEAVSSINDFRGRPRFFVVAVRASGLEGLDGAVVFDFECDFDLVIPVGLERGRLGVLAVVGILKVGV